MSIKKTKLSRKNKNKSKRLLQKLMNKKRTKTNHNKHNSHKSNSHKSNISKRKINLKQKYNNHRGGYSSCDLASVKEPSFNVDALGSIAGINIPSSRGVIYRPNCKTDSYQAMKP